MTIRVHELATDLHIPTERVLELLRAMSVHTKGPSSSVETQHADAVRCAYGASANIAMTPAHRYVPRHQHAVVLLRMSVSGKTQDEWLAEQERIRLVNVSRQAAAAKSRELYESAQLDRREANRLRWEGSYEGPRGPRHLARSIVVFQGGSPGLGKRH